MGFDGFDGKFMYDITAFTLKFTGNHFCLDF